MHRIHQQLHAHPQHYPVSAVCKRTIISIASPAINRLECCCVDCNKGIQWCTDQGGPASSHALIADLVYFPNLVKVQSGRQHLKVFLIKKEYNTRRVVATCCWTPLLGDHPNYRNQRIVAYLPHIVLNLKKELILFPPASRFFTKDVSSEELELLPDFHEPTSEQAFPIAPSLQDLERDTPNYESAQILIDSLGPIRYMDPAFEGKPTSWNQQYPDGPHHSVA